MRQSTPWRGRAIALLGSLTLVTGACDLLLLTQPAAAALMTMLSAKYPLAVALAAAALWTRRLLERAHDACLRDLRD